MRLNSLSYVQFPDDPKEWRLDALTLGDINLIVGKNASGKTRTVNVLWTLARLLSGAAKLNLSSANYLVHFDHDGVAIEYELKVTDTRVTRERFVVAGETKLERGDRGEGRIWTKKLGQFLEFQTPQNEIATVVRRDQLQHDFLEPLHAWAQTVLYYAFGTTLGRDRLCLLVNEPEFTLDVKDAQGVVGINFAALELNPSCILIDDIGEGLDFSRSCALIDLLKEKSGKKIQLVMASNDRFVMNRVPLQAWTVLTRLGSTCRVNNYENSKQTFDEFSFTGLNNFDFFATDFVSGSGEIKDTASGEGR